MKDCRATAASLDLWLRPRLLQPEPPAPEAPAPAEADVAEPAAAAKGSPEKGHDNFETLYFSCSTAVQGVFQVHKAQNKVLTKDSTPMTFLSIKKVA